MLKDRNRVQLEKFMTESNVLENEIKAVARCIGQDGFADPKLTQSLTRRLTATSNRLQDCQRALSLRKSDDARFSQALEWLQNKIDEHTAALAEEEMTEVVARQLEPHTAIQGATRQRD
jgi:hypothetical protein